MKHNQFSKHFKFIKNPIDFSKNTDKSILQYCLGGTLYMPGTKYVVDKILNKDMYNVTSMVMCFEDAIDECDVKTAEDNVLLHLDTIYNAIKKNEITIDEIPLIFLRIRNEEQFQSFTSRLNASQASVLSGFVFPKFYSKNAAIYLNHLRLLNKRFDTKLYGMPILEGITLAHIETRIQELNVLKEIIEPYNKYILNIRVGGTDFSSVFGVRRDINTSIYDILTVRDILSDILNFFSRSDSDYTVSGPVWEYFLAYKKDDLNHLIERKVNHSVLNRETIFNDAVDGLLREIVLDKANGFIGKTIIHPSHIKIVNAMQAVTKEEYEDAMQVLKTSGGVIKSKKANKMNEVNPHRNWANRIEKRALAYGVIEDESSYLKLILG